MKMKKSRWSYFLLLPFPAMILGALAMQAQQIPISLWMQNLLMGTVMVAMSLIVLRKDVSIKHLEHTLILSVILLGIPFFCDGAEGVHRWIQIGGLGIHIASIVIPIVIIQCEKGFTSDQNRHVYGLTIFVAVLLCCQPDASQTTAFVAPMLFLLLTQKDHRVVNAVTSACLCLVMVWSWFSGDSLETVPYVETIVGMLESMGIEMLILGMVSLVILPMPWILFPPRASTKTSIAMGLYFSIVLLFALTGNFPMPMMGYGLSPVVGYYLAMMWYLHQKTRA